MFDGNQVFLTVIQVLPIIFFFVGDRGLAGAGLIVVFLVVGIRGLAVADAIVSVVCFGLMVCLAGVLVGILADFTVGTVLVGFAVTAVFAALACGGLRGVFAEAAAGVV